MKPKLAPRHIIPVVCYSLLLLGFVLTAVLGFALNFINTESLEGTGVVGLLILGLGFALKAAMILIGIGGAMFTLFPLVFSSVNIAKRERKLAIACLVFDALWCQTFASATLAILIDFEGISPFLVSLPALGLCALTMAMNILNIKYNVPLPTGDGQEQLQETPALDECDPS